MRQSQKLPIFTVITGSPSAILGTIVILAAMVTGCTACKRTIRMAIPEAKLQAKEADFDQLLGIVNQFSRIRGLKAEQLKVEYTFEKQKGNLNDLVEMEKWPKSPATVFLRNPDSIRLMIRDPMFSSNRLIFVSVGDEFRLWFPGKNTFYIGRNSSKELVSDQLEEVPPIPIRAYHIFEAILPRAVASDNPGIRILETEEEDASAKYYLLMVCYDRNSIRLRPSRAFWIERSQLSVTRQQIYDDEGRVTEDVAYSDFGRYGQFSMPRRIRFNRPLDGYTLALEVKDWQIDPDMGDDLFKLPPPEKVKVVRFK